MVKMTIVESETWKQSLQFSLWKLYTICMNKLDAIGFCLVKKKIKVTIETSFQSTCDQCGAIGFDV